MSIFTTTERARLNYSTFNLSHDKKFSFNMGDLIPTLVQEVVPGDNFSISTQQMLRLMPMVSPVMHEVNVYNHFFYVPNRILWDGFEEFLTGDRDGKDVRVTPRCSDDGIFSCGMGSLGDYLGLPTGQDLKDISALPFAAYQMIYNEFYRDQNLIEDLTDYIMLKDGYQDQQGAFELYKLRKRAWGHDYFTSCLPYAQKGEPVKIPLFSNSDLIGLSFVPTAGQTKVYDAKGQTITAEHQLGNNGADVVFDTTQQAGNDLRANIDVTENTFLDPDNAVGNLASIVDFRRAFKLQEYMERLMRGGSRYSEWVKSFFNQDTGDSRVNRPEFLGGNSSPIMISEVLQASETNETPLGEMGGHGVNVGRGGSINRKITEHGFIIGIMSVIPKTAYQQGVQRMWRKHDKFDHFTPQFEHIGEQEVYNWEIFADGTEEDNGVFGYIPRYAEYKYNPSTVHGYLKSSLSNWHLGNIYAERPTLSKEFIECKPRHDIFAITDENEHKLICQLFLNIKAKRPMSYYSNPKF